jgi:protein translocase SecG subunit
LWILLQEPKGGGLAEAFGGLGASTFGVKSSGTNRFTFTVFAVFLFSALGIHALKRGPRIVQPEPEKQEQPADEQGGGAPASPIKLEGVGQDGNPIKIETGQGGKVEVGGQPGGQSPSRRARIRSLLAAAMSPAAAMRAATTSRRPWHPAA